MNTAPEQIPTSKWCRGKGVIWLYSRRGSSGGGNSGPTGKRAKRFYPMRALRRAMGKHGIAKLHRPVMKKVR